MTDARYLASLQRHWRQHRLFPSLNHLRAVVGLSSTSSVYALVSRLCESGHLHRENGRIAPGPRFFALAKLPHLGHEPGQGDGNSECEAVTLDDLLIDEPDHTVLHRMQDDSMTGMSILAGDGVAVELGSTAKPGDVVLAAADGRLVVATLGLDDDDQPCLILENSSYDPIRPRRSLEVVGVVVGVARRLRPQAA